MSDFSQQGLVFVRVAALLIALVVLVASCSGPTTPAEQDFEPAVILAFDSDSCYPGEIARLRLGIRYTSSGKDRTDSLEGFNLQFAYNHRSLSFLGGIEMGDAISEWEYFTYRYRVRPIGDRDTTGVIKVVGIRDMDNGQTPNPLQRYPEGTLLEVSFLVSAKWEDIDSTFQIEFLSFECGDNSLFPYDRPGTYYLPGPTSDDSYFGPIVDTTLCSGQHRLEPVVEFKNGAIRIEEPIQDTIIIHGP
jgi:hypothetical protein